MSPRLCRARRRHRHRADPRRRRRARRRGAVDARDHRQADQVHRHRREDRRARAVPRRAHRRPHPRHGRRRQPGREGGRDGRPGRGRKARRGSCEKGSFDLDDLAGAAAPAPQDGRHGRRCSGMLPGIGKIKKQLDERQSRRDASQAAGSDHRLDDQGRAAQPEAAQRLAPAPHRRRLRAPRCPRSTGS